MSDSPREPFSVRNIMSWIVPFVFLAICVATLAHWSGGNFETYVEPYVEGAACTYIGMCNRS